jgi:hypothetical protein
MFQPSNATVAMPDFQVMAIKHLGSSHLRVLIVNAIQLVDAGDPPVIIKDIYAVIHESFPMAERIPSEKSRS